MATADHLYDVFLTQTSAHEISRLLEAHYERLPVGVLSIGLHTLARTALVLPASERKALAELPWFGKMMMRLGGMLSGATVTDVKGLTSILWALSCLEQAESPLLQGLVKRLLLLAQHGRVTSAQLLLATQALAKLKQLGGPIGQAVTSIVLPRLADLNAAHLGTLSRALVEGLGMQAEPLLRAVSTARLEEFTIEGSRTRAQLEGRADEPGYCETMLAHGAASLLIAFAMAQVAPPAASVEPLTQALSGMEARALGLQRAAELTWALQTLASAEVSAKSVQIREQLLDGCEQAMRLQVEQIPPNELPSRLAELEKLGKPMQPALVLARERAAHLAESLSLDIERATNETALLQLLTERPVSGFQLCTGLSKLARQVQLCPDPESWAASIVSRSEFGRTLAKLHDFLPSLDSGYLREALCALAELSVRGLPLMACPACTRSPRRLVPQVLDTRILTAFFEEIASRLHALTASDTAHCLWAFCTLGLAQVIASDDL